MQQSLYQKTATFFRSRTGHLALTYFAIVMLMSVLFSVVTYSAAAKQLGRQMPPPAYYDHGKSLPINSEEIGENPRHIDFDDFFTSRIDDGDSELMERLILLNVVMVFVGGLGSYWLARYMVRPTEVVLATQRHLLKQTGKFPELDEIEKIKHSTFELTSVPLSAVITAAHKAVPALQKKHITLDDSIAGIKVHAHKQLLTRLIDILLTNAAEYSAEGTTVHIAATAQGDKVRLSVRDEGVGISRRDVPHLFTPFYQADQSHPIAERQGHGLGLAVVRAIANVHHAKLRIRSTPDQGTTVVVILAKG